MKYPKTFKEWMQLEFDRQQLADIADHGADTGWSGLTYTSDCVELFDRYQTEIWDMAVNTAEDLGEKNVLVMVATFNRVDMASTVDGFKNLMVWFAAEEYARQIVDHLTDETEGA